ncbi:MAG TPA: universal stress protein, partial [Acidimicrobiales bacterium]|nr:universal stress protein [Acidimicrobiales bacterium]
MDAYEESMVAVGVDGSKESRATVRWAAAEAFWREAELCLVYAYTYPVSIAWHRLPLVARPECCDQAAEEMLAHIERDELGGYPSLAVRRIAVPGLAADVLMEVGRTADLLVVGATARHPLGHTLLGSVARALTR